MGWHVEYVETSRLHHSIPRIISYWTPAGCILEGHDDDLTFDKCLASIPVVWLDPSEAVLKDPNVATVTTDAPKIVDLAIRELSLAGSESFAFVSWTTPAGWSERRLSTRNVASNSGSILQALDQIRRDACSGLKAADVVREMGVSERMAEMTFKAATGKRITEEITDVRLEHVKELLLRQSQTIAPIANLCGWDSAIYLKRLFKQRTGMSMREWRRKHLDMQ